MNKHLRSSLFRITILLALLALLAACGNDETPAPGADTPGITLSITGSECPGIVIRPGEQVTWVNEDSVEHPLRIEYPDGETVVDLGVVQPGDSAGVNFPEAGIYSYICTTDEATTGTITVQP